MRALAQLQHVDSLELFVYALDNPADFSHFCAMRSLKKLQVDLCNLSQCIPFSSFSALPALSVLQELSVPRVESRVEGRDVRDLMVDCLIRMPKLRCISGRNGLRAMHKARIRDALPRLETLV